MNLLELMLHEKVEWHVRAKFAAQDITMKVFMYSESPVFDGDIWCGNSISSPWSLYKSGDDFRTRIITREEYQSAGGWMKWEGGKRPVPSGSMVNFVARGDVVILVGIAGSIEWHHCGEESDIIAYRIINQLPVQLDNPEIEPDFEPFVSVEDAHECKAENAITPSKYTKQIHGVSVDVYDVLMAWGVTNPALQHLIKKALQCGQRGHKDKQQDLQDIIDSAIRAKELECLKN